MKPLIAKRPDRLSIGIAAYCPSCGSPEKRGDEDENRFPVGGFWVPIPAFVFLAR